MISQENLKYYLVGNSYPNGRYNPQDGIMEYVLRVVDIEATGHKNLDSFIQSVHDSILSKMVEVPVNFQYEYAWSDDRDIMICEIVYSQENGDWVYHTYYRQQHHSIAMKDLDALVLYIKTQQDDHRINRYI